MTNWKQRSKHYSKTSHKTKQGAIIACKKLEKKGVHVKYYKRGNLYYLTERFKGARVLEILDSIKESK